MANDDNVIPKQQYKQYQRATTTRRQQEIEVKDRK
jgi:hypothetical protein